MSGILTLPLVGVRSIAISLSVCLSVYLAVQYCYILPVLCTTSSFYIVGKNQRQRIFLTCFPGSSTSGRQTTLFGRVRQVAAPGAKYAVSQRMAIMMTDD